MLVNLKMVMQNKNLYGHIFKICRRHVGSESNRVTIYVDGACSNNGKSNARAGIGNYCLEDPKLNASIPVQNGRATSQRAELLACIHANENALKHNYNSVIIKTDSYYVYKGVTDWLPNSWQYNGFMSTNGKPIVNEIEFKQLYELMKRITTEFVKIPRDENTMADSLARMGARSIKE